VGGKVRPKVRKKVSSMLANGWTAALKSLEREKGNQRRKKRMGRTREKGGNSVKQKKKVSGGCGKQEKQWNKMGNRACRTISGCWKKTLGERGINVPQGGGRQAAKGKNGLSTTGIKKKEAGKGPVKGTKRVIRAR